MPRGNIQQSKIQDPEKPQAPIIKPRNACLVFGRWSFSGAWRLDFWGFAAPIDQLTLNSPLKQCLL